MAIRPLIVAGAAACAALALAAPAAALTNTQVVGLQVALRAHGLYRGPIDGIAGPATSAAVRRFQRQAGLPADGIAGRKTRLALGPLGQPLYGRRVLVRGTVGWDVSVLQFLLARRGFLAPSEVDGRLGPRTHRALRRFQRRVGLVVDGVAGRATLTLLDSTRSLASPMRATQSTSRAFVRAEIARWAAHYGVDARLVRALAWQESGYQNHVVSSAGALGVMQVTPATWEFVEVVLIGRRIARTAAGNVRVGTAFLRHLLRLFRGDERLALAAYYQGAKAVRERGLFPETRTYVEAVRSLKGRV